jgi:hypothetical protein
VSPSEGEWNVNSLIDLVRARRRRAQHDQFNIRKNVIKIQMGLDELDPSLAQLCRSTGPARVYLEQTMCHTYWSRRRNQIASEIGENVDKVHRPPHPLRIHLICQTNTPIFLPFPLMKTGQYWPAVHKCNTSYFGRTILDRHEKSKARADCISVSGTIHSGETHLSIPVHWKGAGS